MDITLRSEVIRKLSPRGILAYVAMCLSPRGKQASITELAKSIGVNEYLLEIRPEDLSVLSNVDFSRRRPSRKQIKPFVLPDWIPAEAWEGFVDGRRRKHGAPTVYGSNLLVKKLEKLKDQGHDPVEVLNQSTVCGYAGVFPIRPVESGNGFHSQPPAPKLRVTEFKR
jgi:hypothetical protein